MPRMHDHNHETARNLDMCPQTTERCRLCSNRRLTSVCFKGCQLAMYTIRCSTVSELQLQGGLLRRSSRTLITEAVLLVVTQLVPLFDFRLAVPRSSRT